ARHRGGLSDLAAPRRRHRPRRGRLRRGRRTGAGERATGPARGNGLREALGLSGRLSAVGFWGLLAVLLALIAINLPELGSDPWPFVPGAVDPQGVLGPLVRAAGEEWDVGIARAACFLA